MGGLLGSCCNRYILKPHWFDTIEVDFLYSHHMPWAAGMGMGVSGKGAATFCLSDWWKSYYLQTTASVFPQDKKEDGCSHTPRQELSGVPVLNHAPQGSLCFGASSLKFSQFGAWNCLETVIHEGYFKSGPYTMWVMLTKSPFSKFPPLTGEWQGLREYFSLLFSSFSGSPITCGLIAWYCPIDHNAFFQASCSLCLLLDGFYYCLEAHWSCLLWCLICSQSHLVSSSFQIWYFFIFKSSFWYLYLPFLFSTCSYFLLPS